MIDVRQRNRSGWGGAIVHGGLLLALAIALGAVFRAGVVASNRRERADTSAATARPHEADCRFCAAVARRASADDLAAQGSPTHPSE